MIFEPCPHSRYCADQGERKKVNRMLSFSGVHNLTKEMSTQLGWNVLALRREWLILLSSAGSSQVRTWVVSWRLWRRTEKWGTFLRAASVDTAMMLGTYGKGKWHDVLGSKSGKSIGSLVWRLVQCPPDQAYLVHQSCFHDLGDLSKGSEILSLTKIHTKWCIPQTLKVSS